MKKQKELVLPYADYKIFGVNFYISKKLLIKLRVHNFAKTGYNNKKYNELMASFGSYIKTNREDKGWSQTEFGAKVKINTPAVSKIENDRKRFPVAKLELLAQLFQLDYNKVKDLYFADKFAKEAYEHRCSDNIFKVAENQSIYIKAINAKQGKLKF